MIGEANRVPPSWVRERQRGNDPPLLVCAYDDEEKCRSIRIPGSLTRRELTEQLPAFSQDKEIVFYCS
jgi:hypothetical protein